MRRIGSRCIGGSGSRGFQGGLRGCTVDGIGVWPQLSCIEDVGRHFWRTGSSTEQGKDMEREDSLHLGLGRQVWLQLGFIGSATQMFFIWLYAKVDQVRL